MTVKVTNEQTNIALEQENLVVRVLKNTLRVSTTSPARIINVIKNVNTVSVRQFGSITTGESAVYYPTGWL